MQTQILIIHGGNTFKNDEDYLNFLKKKEIKLHKDPNWTQAYLDAEIGDNFEIIRPQMPLKENSKYRDWKIVFEKYLAKLGDKIILIGVSLGGIFLAQYLAENKVNKNILSTILVAPPYDDSLPDEELCNGFKLPNNLSLLEDNTQSLELFFSGDDPVVPASEAKKYAKKLKYAKIYTLKNMNGHFRVAEFPEIIKSLKEINN